MASSFLIFFIKLCRCKPNLPGNLCRAGLWPVWFSFRVWTWFGRPERWTPNGCIYNHQTGRRHVMSEVVLLSEISCLWRLLSCIRASFPPFWHAEVLAWILSTTGVRMIGNRKCNDHWRCWSSCAGTTSLCHSNRWEPGVSWWEAWQGIQGWGMTAPITMDKCEWVCWFWNCHCVDLEWLRQNRTAFCRMTQWWFVFVSWHVIRTDCLFDWPIFRPCWFTLISDLYVGSADTFFSCNGYVVVILSGNISNLIGPCSKAAFF